MEDSAYSINANSSILVSRNAPIALVVGAAGFIGSHLSDKLLAENIQVVGIDDFSLGKKEYLNEASKSNKFHLLNKSILDRINSTQLSLPRLDYVFFVVEKDTPELYYQGLLNVMNFVLETRDSLQRDNEKGRELVSGKPRIVFVSSVELYNHELEGLRKLQKEGEVRFARFVKTHNLNGRVVRLASIFGPRMHFREPDPLVKLLQSSLTDKIQEFNSSTDFSTRALYIDDAVKLILKSVLSGSTAHKIYDGAMTSPIKISEIKQILLDPVWHEMKHFQPSELPPWPTPNLTKTIKELSWHPSPNIIKHLKDTIAYFKENNISVPRPSDNDIQLTENKRWSFENYKEAPGKKEDPEVRNEKKKKSEKKLKDSNKLGRVKSKLLTLIIIGIIFFGLLYPPLKIIYGAYTIKQNLSKVAQDLTKGDFADAKQMTHETQKTLVELRQVLNSLFVLKKVGIMTTQFESYDQLLAGAELGISGVDNAISGTDDLFKTTKIISGESTAEPQALYKDAQVNLADASQKLTKVQAIFGNPEIEKNLPSFLSQKIRDLNTKLALYNDIVEKARSASFLMPEITAVDGRKTYLVLLLNNLELRPGGGFIGSYARLTFEKGRITDIKVDDIYNLDGGLKDVITPPADLKSDLNQDRFYLRDSNTEPDFPTDARQAEFFYKREAGEQVNGVFALDLSASGKLATAVGGLDLPEYGEHIDDTNLFEKAISHAEVNFFPGSQAKKNYLTSLQTQLFNKVFYLSKQNWPAIIQALSDGLEEKHLQIYLADPEQFSYLASENWAGVLPRGVETKEGQTADFLAPVESNMGANKANYYLNRKYNLETTFTKDGQILHRLTINYKNNSPSEVFPAGKYRNRFKVYLPLGTKLTKASFGGQDILGGVASFVDYSRTAYSTLLEINPGEEKDLVLEYTLLKPLSFSNSKNTYRMDIIKQAGTIQDPLEWKVSYPINYRLESPTSNVKQQLVIVSDLKQDKSFVFKFSDK
jgi:nucleoside-diphosphate-sugar epimerase